MSSISVHDVYNFRQAAPDLATSGQPTEEQLGAIAAAGYNVVVNLALHDDPRYSLRDEAASVEAFGLDYVHIPVQFGAPKEEDLLAFFDAMDSQLRPSGMDPLRREHARYRLCRALSRSAAWMDRGGCVQPYAYCLEA
jgi:hypothetical protein